MRVNRDTIVAIVLLAICAIFWQQSFEIRLSDSRGLCRTLARITRGR